MSSAYFYRERKGLFVVISLAGWLVLLGLFGRYLPANAQVNSRQIAITIHGNEVIGNWIKENGRWKFDKISKVIKFNRSATRKTALIIPPTRPARVRVAMRQIPAMTVPQTTASVGFQPSKKRKKRVARAELANEIGRWAKIDNRWEWRRTVKKAVRDHEEVRDVDERQARWMRRNGVWVFDIPAPDDLIINI